MHNCGLVSDAAPQVLGQYPAVCSCTASSSTKSSVVVAWMSHNLDKHKVTGAHTNTYRDTISHTHFQTDKTRFLNSVEQYIIATVDTQLALILIIFKCIFRFMKGFWLASSFTQVTRSLRQLCLLCKT